jgi:decaprenyl-phosphate phosphoribosyltransferase
MNMFSLITPYIRLMRPRQWMKNGLVFAPPFFAGTLFYPHIVVNALLAFLAFCLAASVVYVVNDIVDSEADKGHPKKSKRPIAAGEVSKRNASIFAGMLVLLTLAITFYIPALLPILVGYLGLNLAYSLYLKHVAVVDAVVVAMFYVLRVAAGGAATATILSPWITLATFFFALFLVGGKRKGESVHTGRRKVLDGYAPQTIDALLTGSLLLAIASYSVWAVLLHPSMLATVSVVIIVAALLRLLNGIYLRPEEAETPETFLFTDRWTLFLTLLWAATMFALFYW